MLFVCNPKILHKDCFQFLLRVKMAQEKLKTMLLQDFWGTNIECYGMLWYFLEWSIEDLIFIPPTRNYEHCIPIQGSIRAVHDICRLRIADCK